MNVTSIQRETSTRVEKQVVCVENAKRYLTGLASEHNGFIHRALPVACGSRECQEPMGSGSIWDREA
jgi:hypothetical protein